LASAADTLLDEAQQEIQRKAAFAPFVFQPAKVNHPSIVHPPMTCGANRMATGE
jgi:hypothetical protein